MSVYSKIALRNYRQNLGRYNKQLVIRLALNRSDFSSRRYNLVLTRRRARPGSRYDLLGSFVFKSNKKDTYNCLYINILKFKQALFHGARIHASVYKLIIR
jgi:hypothetical protein